MNRRRIVHVGALMVGALVLSGCSNSGGGLGGFSKRLFGGIGPRKAELAQPPANPTAGAPPPVRVLESEQRRGFLGLGRKGETGPQVNADLWAATLDVLGTFPIRAADPYSGVIITGFGRAPGSARSYRAEARINSAVLDATSLELVVYTANGRVSRATTIALRDAIFNRARELRIARR